MSLRDARLPQTAWVLNGEIHVSDLKINEGGCDLMLINLQTSRQFAFRIPSDGTPAVAAAIPGKYRVTEIFCYPERRWRFSVEDPTILDVKVGAINFIGSVVLQSDPISDGVTSDWNSTPTNGFKPWLEVLSPQDQMRTWSAITRKPIR